MLTHLNDRYQYKCDVPVLAAYVRFSRNKTFAPPQPYDRNAAIPDL
jgi:hypothetical protein